LFDLLYFVRAAEAIEEMNEWNARLECRCLRDEREIHDLLNAVRSEQPESRGAGGQHVAVVAENRERIGSDRTGGNVKDG